jgi:hypothetical protein
MRPRKRRAPLARCWRAKRNGRSMRTTVGGMGGTMILVVPTTTTVVAAAASVPVSSTATKVLGKTLAVER